MNKCPFIFGALSLWVLVLLTTANGYESATHEAISQEAVERSAIDKILKETLGIRAGIDETISGKKIVKWIAEGSRREDDFFRPFHHFHNPLRSWDDAGFSAVLPFFPSLELSVGSSSILWGQEPRQGWAWPNARQFYYQALTAPNLSQRERALALTFRSLGHLIHLIQDAAVPAHTRNDPHRAFSYETLVASVQLSPDQDDQNFFFSLLTNPHLPDPKWASLEANRLAPIPIANLIDTDRYEQTNPEVTTEALIGLAEYTNANFFSEDTIFSRDFPYPARSSVKEAEYLITLRTGERVRRLYDEKVVDGDTGYRLAIVGVLRDYIQRYQLDPKRYRQERALDEGVYKDYAARLLPRAVGYSAALLDYFFRGRLEARLGNGTLEVLNASDEPLGPGTLALYYDDDAGTRRLVAEWPIERLEPGAQLSFSASAPPGSAGYVLVYRGALGGEADAVIGKVIQPEQYLFFEQLSYQSLAVEQDPWSFTDWCGNFFYYTAYWPTSIHITGRLHKSPGVEVLKIEVAPVEASDVTYDRNSQSVTIHFAPRLFKPAALIITTDAPVPNPQGFDYPFPNKYVYSQPAGPDDFFPVEGTGSQRATTIYFPLAFPSWWETYGSSIPASCSNRPGESQSNAYIVYGDFSLAPVAGTHRLLTGGYTGYDWESVGEGPQYSRLGAVVEWYIDNGVVDPPGALTEPKVTVEHYYKYFEEKGPEGLKAALPRSSFSVNLLE